MPTAMVCSIEPRVHAMQGNGETMSSMAMAWRHGQMEPSLKASTMQARGMDSEGCHGQMIHTTRDTSMKTTFMVRVTIIGVWIGSTAGSGDGIEWTEMAPLCGPMAAPMLASSRRTSNMVRESSIGKMEDRMMGSGEMTDGTGMVNSSLQMVSDNLECGTEANATKCILTNSQSLLQVKVTLLHLPCSRQPAPNRPLAFGSFFAQLAKL
mmetsp:Transcript_47168/g.86571  ORF Transcript_47168/g.86571 Transcript_47168/m.86571 type:complete len:209 (+) Transcript_47168:319-945(+)